MGQELANSHVNAGYRSPQTVIFENSWATVLTGADIFTMADIDSIFANLSTFDQELILIDFEEGYYSAPVWENAAQTV